MTGVKMGERSAGRLRRSRAARRARRQGGAERRRRRGGVRRAPGGRAKRAADREGFLLDAKISRDGPFAFDEPPSTWRSSTTRRQLRRRDATVRGGGAGRGVRVHCAGRPRRDCRGTGRSGPLEVDGATGGLQRGEGARERRLQSGASAGRGAELPVRRRAEAVAPRRALPLSTLPSAPPTGRRRWPAAPAPGTPAGRPAGRRATGASTSGSRGGVSNRYADSAYENTAAAPRPRTSRSTTSARPCFSTIVSTQCGWRRAPCGHRIRGCAARRWRRSHR